MHDMEPKYVWVVRKKMDGGLKANNEKRKKKVSNIFVLLTIRTHIMVILNF